MESAESCSVVDDGLTRAPSISGRSGMRRSAHLEMHITLWSLIAIGVLFALLNLRLPVARNALDYAKTALDVLQHHFNLLAVVKDYEWTGGKPILFSILAAPFTWLWNANVGVVVASVLGTAFYLWTVCLALVRLNKISGADPSLISLELVLTALNPLTVYQFWSGYPDSLFAGFVLLAFTLTDTIANEPQRDTRPHIVMLGVTIFAAIHTKLYGAILGLACPVYLLMSVRRPLGRIAYLEGKLALLAIMFGVLAVTLVTARLGLNPLLVLGQNSGFLDYLVGLGGGEVHELGSALLMIGVAFLLVFQVALLYLLNGKAWSRFALAPTVFCAIYLAGLLPASGASFNIRYCLPAFAFLAPALATGARSLPSLARRAVLGFYCAISVLLILNFNAAWISQALRPIAVRVFRDQLEPGGLLENLRLSTQVALKEQIDTINANAPSGSVLYWSSDYYGKATHGLAHDLGVKRNLNVRYVLDPADVPLASSSVFLVEFTSSEPVEKLWNFPSWATPTALGHGVFRLDPVSVQLTAVSGDGVPEGSLVRLRVDVSSGDNVNVITVDVGEGQRMVYTGAAVSQELTLKDLAPGRHEFWARARYSDTAVASADPLVVYVGIPAFEQAATSASDLVTEYRDGEIVPVHEVLPLDQIDRAVGIRFTDIPLSRGTRVTAHLQLAAAAPESGSTVLKIRAELSANAAGLRRDNGDLSRRPRTATEVKWDMKPWQLVGDRSNSPDLAPIIQEILAQEHWQPGNSLMLLIHVTGAPRFAQSYGKDGGGPPPTLYIQTTPGNR